MKTPPWPAAQHIEQLQTDLRTLAEDAGRLSASLPSDETPGASERLHVGDGDRQYLTGPQGRWPQDPLSGRRVGEHVGHDHRRRHPATEPAGRRQGPRRQVAAGPGHGRLALDPDSPRQPVPDLHLQRPGQDRWFEERGAVWLDGGDREALEARGSGAARRGPRRGHQPLPTHSQRRSSCSPGPTM